MSKVIWNQRQIIEKTLNEAKRIMTTCVIVVEGKAKDMAPYEFGRLRSSITHEVTHEGGEIVGRVGTNVDYAIYQEFGTGIYAENGKGRKTKWLAPIGGGFRWTVGNKAQPFLRPALEHSKAIIMRLFRNK